jgi:parallel beta-helix repeat protein
MRRIIVFVLTSVSLLSAQFSTPGSGVNYSLDSLAAISDGVITGAGHTFYFSNSVTISNTDTLSLVAGDSVLFTGNNSSHELLINGALRAIGSRNDSIYIGAGNDEYAQWYGIRYQNTSTGSDLRLYYCKVANTMRAVDIFGADGRVEFCTIERSSEVALDLSQSFAIIRNCKIRKNFQKAISITLGSSPEISNCTFTENNLENLQPHTIITVGLQGTNSPLISGNTIIGGVEKSGGIAVWALSEAIIEGNEIRDCGYGILCYSTGANPIIRGNRILDNVANPDTVNWCFAIACNGNNAPVITENEMAGHVYGIALINGAHPNIGDLDNFTSDDDGMNDFGGNRYELYNNTNLPIKAENNWWHSIDPDEIESKIVHSVDDPALGTVDFLPFWQPLSLPENAAGYQPKRLELLSIYPNPANPSSTVRFRLNSGSRVQLSIFSVLGELIWQSGVIKMPAGEQHLRWNGATLSGRQAASGIYLISLQAEDTRVSRKLLLVK